MIKLGIKAINSGIAFWNNSQPQFPLLKCPFKLILFMKIWINWTLYYFVKNVSYVFCCLCLIFLWVIPWSWQSHLSSEADHINPKPVFWVAEVTEASSGVCRLPACSISFPTLDSCQVVAVSQFQAVLSLLIDSCNILNQCFSHSSGTSAVLPW